MVQKSRNSLPNGDAAKRRPRQDMAAAKQSANFPSVGMTLRSYKYDPRDHYKVPAGRGVVVKQPLWKRLAAGAFWKRVAIILSIIVLLTGAWLGGKFAYNAHKLFKGNILGVLASSRLKGEDQGRVNILLAGNSADDAGHNGGNLTDSIMIVSVDTKNNTAFLLSVPRDLWVDIPGDGHAKINEAYVDGESEKFSESGYPDGGMGLLEKVISEDFGIDINYYALVNYSALRDAVNAVGGVDFTVKSADPRGLYDPNIDYTTHGPLVKLSNGVHHLNGQQALDLSRARGDSYRSYGFPGSDFDRTEHQRQLLIALKNKSTSAGVIANPAKISSLSDAIGNNVKTDFSTSEVRRLYDLSKKISSNNIKSLSLNSANGKNLLTSYTARGGQSALIPVLGVDEFYDIQTFLKQQTSNNPMVREGAKVAVLNSTDYNGLASKEKTSLRNQGLNVIKTGDAGAPHAVTTIIDLSQGGMPATKQKLAQIYGAATQFTTVNPYNSRYDADFIVILGNDRIPKTTQTTGTNAVQ